MNYIADVQHQIRVHFATGGADSRLQAYQHRRDDFGMITNCDQLDCLDAPQYVPVGSAVKSVFGDPWHQMIERE